MGKSLTDRFRPKNWVEVVGHRAVVTALQNDKEWKSVLLSGPAGTGKTSIARILAMSLNCLNPKDEVGPCGVCDRCQAILTSCLDYREENVGDSRGIDAMRAVVDWLRVRPMELKRKILVLDECFGGKTEVVVDYGKVMSIFDIVHNPYVTEVLAYDLKLKKVVKKKIVRKIKRKYDGDGVKVVISKNGMKYSVSCTVNHKVYVVGKGEIKAQNLELGDKVIGLSGEFIKQYVCVKCGALCQSPGMLTKHRNYHESRMHEWSTEKKRVVMDLDYWHKDDWKEIQDSYKRSNKEVMIVDAKRVVKDSISVRGELEAFVNNSYAVVESVKYLTCLGTKQHEGWVYNLEVEDTHNYFVCAYDKVRNRLPILVGNCHSLTPAAQNLLLKTLEEPPNYATVILCTTDADSLIPTVLQRCSGFRLDLLPQQLLIDLLLKVTQIEKIEISEDIAMELIVQADGSPRKLLMGLEIVSKGGSIIDAVEDETVFKDLIQHVMNGSTLQAVNTLKDILDKLTADEVYRRLTGYFGKVLKNARNLDSVILATGVIEALTGTQDLYIQKETKVIMGVVGATIHTLKYKKLDENEDL